MMRSNKIFNIEKEKTIPILDDFEIPDIRGEIIFDEEITLNKGEFCIDNRLRLTIVKNQYGVDIYSVDFEDAGGLCYWCFSLTDNEYNEFKSIKDFVNKVFVEGYYNDEGFSCATGYTKEDMKDKENKYEMFEV